jgi:hypothetical protein
MLSDKQLFHKKNSGYDRHPLFFCTGEIRLFFVLLKES